jgi:predicted O-methyltransferase YrrM
MLKIFVIYSFSGAKRVLDIGVFTGASSLAAALALPSDGHLIACDVSEEFTRSAQKYWKMAGVEEKISLIFAPAAQTLQVKS